MGIDASVPIKTQTIVGDIMTTENTKTKKKLDPKTKKIIDIVVTTLEALVVVLCIVFSIIVWTGAAGKPEDRSVNWFAIRTDSMVKNLKLDYDALGYSDKYCFNPGDMVIAKKADFEDIKVGDVVAFKSIVTDSMGNKSEQVVTHRVIEILETTKAFRIAGDKDTDRTDVAVVSYEAIIGKMTGKLKGLGGAMLWLQGYRKVSVGDGVAYEYSGSSVSFLVIIIPLALLLVYNGYYVIKWAMGEKVKKAADKARLEAIQEQAKASIDSESIRLEALKAMMLANGMTEDQIAAYFASQKSKTVETEQSSDTNESATVTDTSSETIVPDTTVDSSDTVNE